MCLPAAPRNLIRWWRSDTSEMNDWFFVHNTLSILAVADSCYRCHCAASVARRLAAGMGSRTALPRDAVSAVALARRAQPRGFTAPQFGRLLGCANVATPTIGG